MMNWPCAPYNTEWIVGQRSRTSFVDELATSIVSGTLGLVSLIYMKALNRTEVHGREAFLNALARPDDVGLITISNHTSALDDPLTLVAMIPPRDLLRSDRLRWGMCATNRCFHNRFLAKLVTYGKTLPVERGLGIYQPGMQQALERLDAGQWVHIFPEGTRAPVPNDDLLPLKPGVGRLIHDAQTPPIVIPFYHSGMEHLLPRGQFLKVGHRVQIVVGEAIMFGDLLAMKGIIPPAVLYEAITARIADRLAALRATIIERDADRDD